MFFSTVAPGASHVGIVIGGDQFIHAPSERGVVRVENLSSQYWSTRYIGAKRSARACLAEARSAKASYWRGSRAFFSV